MGKNKECFAQYARKVHQCSVGKLLDDFAAEGVTTQQASQLTGYAVSTINKYLRKHRVKLINERLKLAHEEPTAFEENFYKAEMNIFNFLSKSWDC
ncbi:MULTISPECIES: hypothetical protein [Cysteiniphilum]|uniref:Uncharacterized protein n=1 Tax=Cysteiniphilum litorale TaxID=2056700 RepID=A0A8J3E8U9_9GAMM|nr:MULTISPECIES: hypothetical protein [Cysteiniphilum]GGF96546.1 hypothetical protein GCM10010995_12210 [Cysteiniphilum litorale]